MTANPDNDREFSQMASAAEALAALIRPLLAGLPPEIVGAALGELTAAYIAGHAPERRAEAHQMLIEVINDLVPVIVESWITDGQVPPQWRASKTN